MLYSFPGKCVLMLASGRILDISCFPIAATFGVVPPCLGWMSKPLHYSYSGPTTAFAPSPVAIIECVKSLRSLSQGPLFPQRTLRCEKPDRSNFTNEWWLQITPCSDAAGIEMPCITACSTSEGGYFCTELYTHPLPELRWPSSPLGHHRGLLAIDRGYKPQPFQRHNLSQWCTLPLDHHQYVLDYELLGCLVN